MIRTLRTNRKQLSIAGLLLASFAAAVLIAFRGGGQRANAATAETIALCMEVEPGLSAGNGVAEVGGNLSRADIERVAKNLAMSPEGRQVPLTELKVNPFRAARSDRAGAEAQAANSNAASEVERKAALQAVQSLRLQSIQHDDSRRTCLINNMVYREGQEADGFFIEEITADTVIVRKGDYRFELKAQ